MYFIQFKNSSKFNNSKEQYNKVYYNRDKVLYRLNMSMVFKKLQNKILVQMKTFDKAYIKILDHLLGRDKHLSVFFRIQSSSMYIVLTYLKARRPWVCQVCPDFGRSVNPISTRGDRLYPPNYYWHTRIFRPSDGSGM